MVTELPTNLACTDMADGVDVQLTWSDNSTNETGFVVQREGWTGSDWGPTTEIAAGAGAEQIVDSPGDGSFRWRIAAANLGNWTAFTDWVYVVVSPTAPLAPSSLAAVLNNGSVALTWADQSRNETRFRITRQTLNGTVWGSDVSFTTSRNQTTYTDSNPAAGTYRYEVRAENSAGTSAYSGWITVIVPGAPPPPPPPPPAPPPPDTIPAAPSDPSASDLGARRALFSWTDNSSNETGFEVDRSPSFPLGVTTVGAGVTSLVDGCGVGTFSYRVRAVNAAGPSAWTSMASVQVADIIPLAPTNLAATDAGNELTVHLTWTDNSDNETSFHIQRETQDSQGAWGNLLDVTVGSNAGVLDDPPGPGTYHYRIAAVGTVGASAWTAWVQVSITDGWTQFTPSSDTRVIYVSSSDGDDANDGLSAATPKRTVAAGKAVLRNGFPDWLLLKRGDIWTDQTIGPFRLSGRSPTEPMLLGAYGTSTERPLLKTGIAMGFESGYGPGETYSQHDLALVGIAFNAHSYDGSTATSGFYWLMPGSNILIEDCKFSGYNDNISIQGLSNSSGSGLTNLTIRRCVIVDSYTTSGHSQGIYLDGINSGLIEENVLDHNGWNESVPGAGATVFNRNMYFSRHCGPLTVRKNISANSASEGLQQRSGGMCEDNLFLRNSTGVLMGQWQSLWPSEATSGTIRNNVVLDARNIDTNPRGFGIQVQQVDGIEMYGNVITHQRTGTDNIIGISLGYNFQNVNIHDNIVYDWTGPAASSKFSLGVNGTPGGVIRFASNDFQQPAGGQIIANGAAIDPALYTYLQNTYYTTAAANQWFSISGVGTIAFPEWVTASGDSGSEARQRTYPDPGRTIETYAASLGLGASLDAFLAQARLQSRTNWHPEYTARAVNDYIRGGFSISLP